MSSTPTADDTQLYIEIGSGEESYLFTPAEAVAFLSEEIERVRREGKFDGCPYEYDFKFMAEKDYEELSNNPDKPTPVLQNQPDDDLAIEAMDFYYRHVCWKLGSSDLGDIERKNYEVIAQKLKIRIQ